ncbi:hypothetical protein B8A39_03135 [Dolosigranulum pigrum]|uniref:DivIVA domain-containing protein n=1 Tax=Dolosigranulum savutiense TaxID=3110288 RepID=A0AB74TVR6_9LACT|nr:DivIVA domain-containing protein [Dolosigranulum pigrum]QTJ34770.1 hypothetical protein FE322_05230 [Dolosigranulum pigrum]RAN52573.1 hypothetical protein B8A39_03135 [Dolosigranulum pigrum]
MKPTFHTQMRGYDKVEVQTYIEKLKDQNNQLEQNNQKLLQENERLKQEENLLKETLIDAKKTAEHIREQAKRDGVTIYNQRVNEAKQVEIEMTAQINYLINHSERMKQSMVDMKKYLLEVIKGYENYIESVDLKVCEDFQQELTLQADIVDLQNYVKEKADQTITTKSTLGNSTELSN